MWLKFLKISMKEMAFTVKASSQVFQCLFFKIAVNLDMPKNEKFMDEQKLMFRKKLHELRYTSTFIFLHLFFL